MLITPSIKIIDLALWLKKESTLIISDLHLGYEEYLQQKGVMLPKFQMNEIVDQLKLIFKKVQPKTIIINGDLKHEFGRVLKQEWKDVLKIVDFLSGNCQELILIKGNHDVILGPIASKRNLTVVNDYQLKDIFIIHGDKLPETKAKTIIIGHEHPSVTIKDGNKRERYKCFLKGKWRDKQLIVMPSFNPLLEGTDIVKEQLLSPFLTDISNFEVYISNHKEVFNFGKVKNLG
tara:strand:+ start:1229 stop:1927 length:699 start_codon:yes stop_codon:yes gene_type:complete